MRVTIKSVTGDEDRDAMFRIRREVFGRERGIDLSRLQLPAEVNALHLLAWTEGSARPVAALTVVDTSGNQTLHESYGLSFTREARTARYTQLAVLRPYRGLDLPLELILEAHRRFIVPRRFDYTWLLFDADRAADSSLCRRLAFVPSAPTFPSEYGLSRSLVRDESAPRSRAAIRQVERYFEELRRPSTGALQVRE